MVKTTKPEPAGLLVLANDAQMRAYLHPVRHRILQFLGPEPLTSSQVAERLGVHPANLTHHFRALLEGRLIRLVEERDTGRVIEKYYQAVARRFEVRPEGGTSPAGVGAKALQMLQADLGAAKDSLADDELQLVVHLQNARLPPKAFGQFAKDLAALVEKWRKLTEHAGETERWYSLGLALYPRAPTSPAEALPTTSHPRRRRSTSNKGRSLRSGGEAMD